MVVVDANVAVTAGAAEDGFSGFETHDLVAPSFMWVEARSAIHEALWRGELTQPDALATRDAVDTAPIRSVDRRAAGKRAWEIADQLGLPKTYDAEYLALADILGCRVVTLDARLRRGADRLGLVVSPTEL